ncbi:hypothetical protein [Dactylosporangium sp. NPDC051541]|uniref:hypothetical protein n=1 Tax=Dactylosporangium sp. NPDC051541 TaxID=3363977 RepID=UPI00379403BE
MPLSFLTDVLPEGSAVTEVVPRTGGSLNEVLAKTLQFELGESAAKRAALLDDYGPLPPRGAERIELYRLYHAIELWTWYTSIGRTKDLDALLGRLRANIARLSASGLGAGRV